MSDNMITSEKIDRMRSEGYFENGSPKEKKLYEEWADIVGGNKNIFLRDFLKNFRLA